MALLSGGGIILFEHTSYIYIYIYIYKQTDNLVEKFKTGTLNIKD